MRTLLAPIFSFILFFANHYALASDFIGTPLDSFRAQGEHDNCWALAGLQWIEGAIQKQTGYGYSFAQDSQFWRSVFKARLLLRWEKQGELSGGLNDANLFSEMGFPNTIPGFFKGSGLQYFKYQEAETTIAFEKLRGKSAKDLGPYAFKNLRFDESLKSSLRGSKTRSEATLVIDDFLNRNGYPLNTISFIWRGVLVDAADFAASINELPNLNEVEDLVWINIGESEEARGVYKFQKLDLGFSVLSQKISSEQAQKLIDLALKNDLAVPVSNSTHTWLIFAKDLNSQRYLFADSALGEIQSTLNPLRGSRSEKNTALRVESLHLPRKIIQQALPVVTFDNYILSRPIQRLNAPAEVHLLK